MTLLLLFKLWNYLQGYVIIIVDGYFIEKFINICAKRRMFLWDVRIQRRHLATMRMGIKAFKQIRPVAKKTGCKVRLLNKRGLPFIFNKYRRRKAFYAGALLFIVLVNFLASFIWSIEITGNNELEQAFIEEELARNGIATGVFKYRVDADSAITQMMLQVDKIVWISINLRGTKVRVDIREREDIPEIVPRDIPCDIVANNDGIIKRVIAKEGIETVVEGDTVKRGQVLISGSIPLKGEENQYKLVHAMGIVEARTWYEAEAPVILEKTERVKTGRRITDTSLMLFSQKLDFFHKRNNFRDYSVSETVKRLSIGDDLVFPIEWITKVYVEETVVNAYVSTDEAKKEATAEAFAKAFDQVPEEAQIIEKIENLVEYDGGIIARVTLECLEDIGSSKEIGGN